MDNSTIVGTSTSIFVNKNNTVYATASGLHSVLIWSAGRPNLTSHIFGNLGVSCGVFVTSRGDVYADNGQNGRVDKWTMSTGNITVAMDVLNICNGLFADKYDNIYCSIWNLHGVFKKSANSPANTSVVVAGTGTNGSTPDMLNCPNGIFVDFDLSLYVADNANHRIQLFRSGQLNGTTVAGVEAAGTITLSLPTSVVLDGDGYLFIVDRGNNRIVGSGPNGFRCIVACTGTIGSAGNQLISPYGLSFDSDGNLYVTDCFNSRIQKFMLARNACGELDLTPLY